jgi:hypothetical protein
MGVEVESGTSWKAGAPKQIVAGGEYVVGPDGNAYRTYDISLDGRKFLMLKNTSGSENSESMPHMIVVRNWFEELVQRVPSR